jgi:hypothetical protein
MSKFSGIRDLDRELLGKLEDRELLKACSIDKYTWEKVCDDDFLKRRLTVKYPEIKKYKSEDETWKSFFSKTTCYIKLMKEKFDFDYTFGDFVTQYNLLKEYSKNKNDLLIESSKVEEISLVIWSFKTEMNINSSTLVWASVYGSLEIVKYLVEAGGDKYDINDTFTAVSEYGKLETVKYLVERGADIRVFDNYALRWASKNGHLETVKYLIESGADFHADNNGALRLAIFYKQLDVEKYLKSL